MAPLHLSPDVVRVDPADLVGNDPGEIAALWIPAVLEQLAPVRPGQVDPFVRRKVFVGVFHLAVSSTTDPVPGVVFLEARPVPERLDAHPAVVHPDDVNRLLFVKAVLAGRRGVLPGNPQGGMDLEVGNSGVVCS